MIEDFFLFSYHIKWSDIVHQDDVFGEFKHIKINGLRNNVLYMFGFQYLMVDNINLNDAKKRWHRGIPRGFCLRDWFSLLLERFFFSCYIFSMILRLQRIMHNIIVGRKLLCKYIMSDRYRSLKIKLRLCSATCMKWFRVGILLLRYNAWTIGQLYNDIDLISLCNDIFNFRNL